MSSALSPDESSRRLPPRAPATAVGAEPDSGGRRYTVVVRDEVVGWTDLEVPFQGHSRAAGIFIPGPAYQHVKPVFDLYRTLVPSESPQPFVAARDALGLALYEEGALSLAAEIELISEAPDGFRAIHTRITDERYWMHILHSTSSRSLKNAL